jgi:hypothetical protein
MLYTRFCDTSFKTKNVDISNWGIQKQGPTVICKIKKNLLKGPVTTYKSLIMDKTPTPALFTQHYISLACLFH